MKSNQRGAMLVVVVWMLVILSIMAIGLGRRFKMDLSLTKYQVNRLKAKYLAWGGLQFALSKLNEDANDPRSARFDNLWECGVRFRDDESPEQIFKKRSLGNGSFEIGRWVKSTSQEDMIFEYGLVDEERKLNLNALNEQNVSILKELLLILGHDEQIARNIALAVLDWKSASSIDEKMDSGGVRSKHAPFDHLEELLLVKGVTPEIFARVKDFVTIYPRDAARLEINVFTASPEILRALSYSLSGHNTNTNRFVADGLVEKILAGRRGPDHGDGTQDDKVVDFTKLGLTSDEQVIFQVMKTVLIQNSRFFTVPVTAEEKSRKTHFRLTAIVRRSDLAVLAWETD